MSDEDDFELVRGSGNVFRDLGQPNADLEQLRAILAARIVRALDARHITVRQARELTGIAAADFSRIRNAKLEHFTVDRLMIILDRLGQEIEITVADRVRRSTRRPRSGAASNRRHARNPPAHP